MTWNGGVIDFAQSYTQVAAFAPTGEISTYTGRPLPPDLNRATFRAPASMQPKPRVAKVVAAVVESPAAPVPEAPAPKPGRLITVGAYLGDESRPLRKTDEEVHS